MPPRASCASARRTRPPGSGTWPRATARPRAGTGARCSRTARAGAPRRPAPPGARGRGPGLDEVAALGGAAVADPGGCRISPTFSPARRGSGTGRPVSTDHICATSATDRAIGPTVSSVGHSGYTPASGISPHCDLSPTVSQAADGSRIEQPVSVPSASSQRPAASGGGGAAGGASRRPAGMHGVPAGPVPLARAEDAPGELGQVGLADEHGPGVEQALDGHRVPLGHVLPVEPGAVGRSDARGIEEVLDGQRAARERAGAGPARVDPGDERVPAVVAHGSVRRPRSRPSRREPRAATPRRACWPAGRRRTPPAARG